jgi:hypothetical protein
MLRVKLAKGRPPANTDGIQAEKIPVYRPFSLKLALPPLATLFSKRTAKWMNIF